MLRKEELRLRSDLNGPRIRRCWLRLGPGSAIAEACTACRERPAYQNSPTHGATRIEDSMGCASSSGAEKRATRENSRGAFKVKEAAPGEDFWVLRYGAPKSQPISGAGGASGAASSPAPASPTSPTSASRPQARRRRSRRRKERDGDGEEATFLRPSAFRSLRPPRAELRAVRGPGKPRAKRALCALPP